MNFIDLAAQQSLILETIEDKISKVLSHGQYINGPEVSELEERLADYASVNYAVGCSNGTDALLMALMAYNISPGDVIFTSPFTFISTAEVIELLHARPVFVDIESGTLNIDTSELEKAIINTLEEGRYTPRGIIPVDIFGQTADYDEINELAEKYSLFVIEDAAQSFGASYKNKKSCSLTDVGITSFYPAKPLGCYGDGGMVFTDNQELYEKFISLRDHGMGKEKYINDKIGINGRLDTIQAAILLAKLDLFDNELKTRNKISDYYNKGLKDTVEIPQIKEHNESAWALYSIQSDSRETMMSKLKEDNIPSVIYYPIPLHLQVAFSHLNYNNGDFPISENVCKRIFSIPMHPYLKSDEQDKIINSILSCK